MTTMTPTRSRPARKTGCGCRKCRENACARPHAEGCTCAKCQKGAGRHGHAPGCGCRKCASRAGQEEQFLGDVVDWLSGAFGGGAPSSSATTYPIDPAAPYGKVWRARQPPGLPTWARKCGKEGSALADVRRVAGGEGLGSDFVDTVIQMAKTESYGGRYGCPADHFDARPKADRPKGKKLVTAWGVFQYNRDAWTNLIARSERAKRRSFIPHDPTGKITGCKSRHGCVMPWDCTPAEEIGKPIAQYAGLWRKVRAAGGSSSDAAGSLRMFHISPAAYREFLDRLKSSGAAAAWAEKSKHLKGRIGKFLDKAGVARPAALSGSGLEMEFMEGEVAQWTNKYPASVRAIIAKGPAFWKPAMKQAISVGLRESGKLADLAFYTSHPDRKGRPISPSEPGGQKLIAQWKSFRKTAQGMLKADSGAKGCNVPAVAVPLPEKGIGFRRSKSFGTYSYGLPETIIALQTIGLKWFLKHPKGPDIQISDISRKCGGQFGKHKSHRIGVDVDIRLIRRDNRMGSTHYSKPVFDKKRTQDLVDIIRSNGVLTPHYIFLHKGAGITGTNHEKYHVRHMHVRFCVPSRYSLSDLKRATYGAGAPNVFSTCS